MPDEESPVPDEILTNATDRLNQDEISLADNEDIIQTLGELTPVYENDRSYFVLGNYDREPIRRLNLVTDRLNRREDAYAFRMVDIRGEWDNSIQKFCLIADLVTYLVGVAEKDPSDFLVEQGLLVGTTEYFSKSHVLKREYEDEDHPFGWMQDGVFDRFENEGRLYRWRTDDDLLETTESLP
ncbi:hypothetical protein [Haladaptatus cibarius]|uniref:hypothetical protein n=1 Tax=Haladaptatus cibarius TaxID=453847 RepID=UPI000678492B|nr:hypothetical protein [Haladaptatus cibarius]